jgi:hypothetical protein
MTPARKAYLYQGVRAAKVDLKSAGRPEGRSVIEDGRFVGEHRHHLHESALSVSGSR